MPCMDGWTAADSMRQGIHAFSITGVGYIVVHAALLRLYLTSTCVDKC